MTLGQRIRKRRKELGMSQTDLAIKLGYKSKVSVSNAENDRDDMTTTRIEKYATALKTTPGYLMGWTEEAEEVISHVKSAIMASKPRSTIQDRITEKLSFLNKDGREKVENYIDDLISSGKYIKTSSEMVSGE